MPYFILVIKTIIIVLVAMAIRATLPRYRFDQATQLTWKHYLFVWFLFLIVNVFYLILFY